MLAPLAVNVVEFPKQMVASEDIMVGRAFTVTFIFVVLTHALASVPVIV